MIVIVGVDMARLGDDFSVLYLVSDNRVVNSMLVDKKVKERLIGDFKRSVRRKIDESRRDYGQ